MLPTFKFDKYLIFCILEQEKENELCKIKEDDCIKPSTILYKMAKIHAFIG